MLGGDSRRSKSFEEREEEYEKARRRIFNREHSVSISDADVDANVIRQCIMAWVC